MCNPNMWTTRYLDAVVDRLGWDAWATTDGDVCVQTPVGRFVIDNTAPDDPEFLHVYCLWELPSHVDRSVLMEIASTVTIEAKGVAVALLQTADTVVFTLEAPIVGSDSLASVDHLAAILPRVQRMLWNAVRLWLEQLRDVAELDGIEAATRAALADGSDG